MTEKRVRCDACGAPALEVRYNFHSDNSGGYTDHVSDSIDLCHEHAVERLQIILKGLPSEGEKKMFGDWAKRQDWEPTLK